MKRYLGLMICWLVAGLCFTACNDDAIDDLQGVYADMTIYTSSQATVQPTTKLKKGIKSLNVDVTDAQGNDIVVNFGSSEWILPVATYTVSDAIANKTCVVKVNGETMQSGDIDVSLIADVYYLSGLFTTQAGKRVKLSYHGSLAFEVGVDDPEASGYTISIAPQQIIDWSTGTPVVVNPEATKYAITVKAPNGNVAAYLEAINTNSLATSALAGEYTIQGNASQPWLMGNGYAYPQYGFMGGTFYVDENGVSQYITAGKVTITVAKDAEGVDLYSFVGTDLTTQSGVTGDAGTGSFKITFASESK